MLQQCVGSSHPPPFSGTLQGRAAERVRPLGRRARRQQGRNHARMPLTRRKREARVATAVLCIYAGMQARGDDCPAMLD